MAQVGDRIIVFLIEPVADGGTVQRSDWPLHVTMLPWFRIAKEAASRLVTALERIARSEASLAVRIGEEVQFGGPQSIAVNLVTPQDKLLSLHLRIERAVEGTGAELLERRWMFEAYTPHVTRQKHGALEPGGQFLLNGFALLRLKEPASCMVERNLWFAGGAA